MRLSGYPRVSRRAACHGRRADLLCPVVPDIVRRCSQSCLHDRDVSVLRDSEPWALNVGDLVQTQQVILTGPDGYAKFQTSDGSTFEVYPSSNVIFRKNPGSLHDLLDLFVGRVKIHIQRLGGQPNPNRIMTPTAVISVRGTIFDVSINDDDETTIVSVEEGSVEVRHALKPGAPKIVNAGESLHVYKDEPLAQERHRQERIVPSHRAWLGRRRLSGGHQSRRLTAASPFPPVPAAARAEPPAPPTHGSSSRNRHDRSRSKARAISRTD